MRRRLILLFVLAALVAAVVAAAPAGAKPLKCTTIQDGTLVYSAGHYLAGQPLVVGYDAYGYNYQARRFQGWYPNVYLGRYGYPPYEGDQAAYEAAHPAVVAQWYWYPTTRVSMPWNDAWLSNKDCNGDGLLDRHLGFASFVGSGAWETNHMWDSYVDAGQVCQWVYFTKIVAVPSSASLVGGVWFGANGTEIGPAIWGEFATIETVYNDPCGGFHGIEYLSPSGPGFGHFAP